MSTNPGDRQAADNKAYKAATGSSPNGVANAYLAQLRGKRVQIRLPDGSSEAGTLIAFDAYTVQIDEALFFKGPGVSIRPWFA